MNRQFDRQRRTLNERDARLAASYPNPGANNLLGSANDLSQLLFEHPMHTLDNVVMSPHYGGVRPTPSLPRQTLSVKPERCLTDVFAQQGRGLPNVEPARAEALLTLMRSVVVEKRWPQGANLEMGY